MASTQSQTLAITTTISKTTVQSKDWQDYLILESSGFHGLDPRRAAAASPGNFLETHSLGLHLRSIKS